MNFKDMKKIGIVSLSVLLMYCGATRTSKEIHISPLYKSKSDISLPPKKELNGVRIMSHPAFYHNIREAAIKREEVKNIHYLDTLVNLSEEIIAQNNIETEDKEKDTTNFYKVKVKYCSAEKDSADFHLDAVVYNINLFRSFMTSNMKEGIMELDFNNIPKKYIEISKKKYLRESASRFCKFEIRLLNEPIIKYEEISDEEEIEHKFDSVYVKYCNVDEDLVMLVLDAATSYTGLLQVGMMPGENNVMKLDLNQLQEEWPQLIEKVLEYYISEKGTSDLGEHILYFSSSIASSSVNLDNVFSDTSNTLDINDSVQVNNNPE